MEVVSEDLRHPEIRTAMINAGSDMTFEVDHCGNGEELAICLHGFPEHSFSWRYQLPMLAKLGFTAWARNLRGYGKTSRPSAVKHYALSTLVEDVAQLIIASGKKKVTLIGHDWGGVIAWEFAAVNRLPLERLIVCNCPHPRSFIDAFGWSQLRKSWYMFFFQIPWIPEYLTGLNKCLAIGRLFEKTNRNSAAFPPEVVEVYKRNASQPGALRAMINFYRGWRLGYLERERNWRNKLFEPIAVPTLLVWGEEDDFLEKTVTVNTHEYVKDLRIRFLPGASHWVQQERPEEVNKLIQAFVTETELTTRID